MPFSTEVQTAIENLKTLYNGDAYDATTNPGGMGEGGHRKNFEPALSDVGIAGEAVGSAADIVQTQSDDVAARSTEFRSRFLGAAATPPTQDGNGDPVSDGGLYWDNNTDTLRVRSNGQWEAPVAAATDYVPASVGGTFTGAVTASGGVVGDLTGNVTGNVTGDVTGNITGDVAGNAATATALQTARTITIEGAVDGAAMFDGTGDVTLTTTVDDNSHNHVLSNITDAGTIASQDAALVDIDGGAIDGTAIGETTRSTAKVTVLDANDAVSFGSTLGVTGAATLLSSLDVTGTSSFTETTTHNGGLQTNIVTGLSGNTVINVPAGQALEVQVGGQKKVDITAEGRITSTQDYLEMQIDADPGNGQYFTSAHSTVLRAENFAGISASGAISVPVAGDYDVEIRLTPFSSTSNTNGRFEHYSGGSEVLANRREQNLPQSTAFHIKTRVSCAAGDYFKLYFDSGTPRTGEQQCWITVRRVV